MKIFTSHFSLFLILIFSITGGAFAQNDSGDPSLWSATSLAQEITISNQAPQILARKASYYKLDFAGLASAVEVGNIISLPNANGGFSDFKLVVNTTMHPELQEKFPSIRTFNVISVESRSTWGKLDISPAGLRVMIFRPGKSTLFIDPAFQQNVEVYMVYQKADFHTEKLAECLVTPGKDNYNPGVAKAGFDYNDCELKTYRIAVSATGEYTSFHGGTVELAMAAIVTTMNRVNGVYETDFGVTMTLIPNNDEIVYTNSATDPFSNGNPGQMIQENQATVTDIIGSANYDIGHVFGTNSGGLAGLGVTCNNNNKARGVTGSAAPVNDPFDIDYVAHEIGHQFGANHSFNNACGGNRNNSTAVEPGSGSTIMAYAGICDPNVQSNSDDHFHGISMTEIGIQITNNNCQVNTAIDNVAPVIAPLSEEIFIPVSTPFALSASVTDADGDELTYCWEQMDIDISPQPPQADSPVGPNFRSNSPVTDSTRYFPSLTAIANNGPFNWERLPSVGREMSFRVSVRDNAPGAGCTQYDNLTVVAVGTAGPFVVSYPSAPNIVWQGFGYETVTWDVANTDAAPINADLVDIYLSVDGGASYPQLLADDVPNTGSFNIQVPNTATTSARIMVMNSEGTFFDISNNDFTIETIENAFYFTADELSATVCQGEEINFTVGIDVVGDFSGPIGLSVSDQPENTNVELSATTVNPGDEIQITITGTDLSPAAISALVLEGTADGVTNDIAFATTIIDANPVAALPVSPENEAEGLSTSVELTWDANASFGVTYGVELATDVNFDNVIFTADGLDENMIEVSELESETTYYWRLVNTSSCGVSAPSSVFEFTTFVCTSTEGDDLPVEIPTNVPSAISSEIEITTAGIVADVNVRNIQGQHTRITDLTFRLISPAGTEVQLTSGNCGLNLTLQSNGDLIVNAPNSIAGEYGTSGAAGFGPNIPAGAITAAAVLTDDGSVNGSQLCGDAINASEIDGNIAIVYRGECPFVDKVINAQEAGAIAVIVINNVPGGVIDMGGTSNQINIPSVMVSLADGNLLVSEIGADAEDFQFGFDDQAASGLIPCPATAGGVFQPSEALDAFNGELATGIWTLQIADGTDENGGSLDGWELEICFSEDLVSVSNVNTSNINIYPNPTTATVWFDLQHQSFDFIRIFDISGRNIDGSIIQGMDQITIDMSGYSNGLYIVHLEGPEGVVTEKVMKVN